MIKRLFIWLISATGLRWLAVSFLLLAFVLVSWNIIQGNTVLYQLINMTGSTFMIVSSLKMKPKDWAVTTFNVVWILVALFALANILHLF